MSDYYEDLANEMGMSDRGNEISEKEFKQMLKNKVYTLPRPYITEDYLAARSQNVYQGPSAHDTMDNLREDFRPVHLALKWKTLLLIGSVLFAGAVVTLVAILKDLQP